MKTRYWQALALAAVGLGAIGLSALDPFGGPPFALLLGAAALPIAMLVAISARMEIPIPSASVVGGATIGPLTAILSYAFVFGFAYLFFFGFADAAASALDTLRVDPVFVEVAASPWTILLFIELALVAPLTEEVGKAMGASFGKPQTRASAFMAGVAAGVGFAVVENILYTSGGGFFGPSWEAIASVRMIGAAVHPLASGLVALGWWEWRNGRDFGLLARRFLSGAGVHALWNGTIVAQIVVGEAYGIEELLGFGAMGVAYSAALGVVGAAALWRMAASLSEEQEAEFVFESTGIRSIGGWIVVASSLLVPVALLFLAFPDLVGG